MCAGTVNDLGLKSDAVCPEKFPSTSHEKPPIFTEEVLNEAAQGKEAHFQKMEHMNGIHFIGIGGIGMSGLATVCLKSGIPVSGSDVVQNAQTRKLIDAGAQIHIGHSTGNIPAGTAKVVVSSAISPNNPELREARELDLPVYHRSDLLAEMFLDAKTSLAVAGCHGKTTVTSIVTAILVECGCDPTCLIGGHLSTIDGNACSGKSGTFVAEADESDATFLKYFPSCAVITNIDNDHMDHYSSLDSIVKAFEIFATHVDPNGSIYLCADDPIARNIALPDGRRIVTYGIDNPATFMANDIQLLPYGSRFTLTIGGIKRGTIELGVPGRHNILNSLPAIAFALDLGMDIEDISKSLALFHGAGRRFEVKGIWEGVTVIDDYGHHPNEIRATLSAARTLGAKRVFVVFQPHRYTRTKFLSDEFGRCFDDCDKLFITDIYPASEEPIPGVSSKLILDHMPVAHRRKVKMVKNFEEVQLQILNQLEPGDVIFTLGAGNVTHFGPEILETMRSRSFKVIHPAV